MIISDEQGDLTYQCKCFTDTPPYRRNFVVRSSGFENHFRELSNAELAGICCVLIGGKKAVSDVLRCIRSVYCRV